MPARYGHISHSRSQSPDNLEKSQNRATGLTLGDVCEHEGDERIVVLGRQQLLQVRQAAVQCAPQTLHPRLAGVLPAVVRHLVADACQPIQCRPAQRWDFVCQSV